MDGVVVAAERTGERATHVIVIARQQMNRQWTGFHGNAKLRVLVVDSSVGQVAGGDTDERSGTVSATRPRNWENKGPDPSCVGCG